MSDYTYKKKIAQRLGNYIEYYEVNPTSPIYTKEQLEEKTLIEMLGMMPNNICVDNEHLDYIASFNITKLIAGDWLISYEEGNYTKLVKDLRTLHKISYCKDLRKGCVDMYLWIQNYRQKWWKELKDGKRTIHLGEDWDDRQSLKLPPLPVVIDDNNYLGYYQVIDGSYVKVSNSIDELTEQWSFCMRIYNIGTLTEKELNEHFRKDYPVVPEQGVLNEWLEEKFPLVYTEKELIHKPKNKII